MGFVGIETPVPEPSIVYVWWTHNLDFWRSQTPSPSKRKGTPVKSSSTTTIVAWTHDARWRWATPSPSKENETPGTGDLEGQDLRAAHLARPSTFRSMLRRVIYTSRKPSTISM
jgi:hypothetical protein